jgi:hypothetical protein
MTSPGRGLCSSARVKNRQVAFQIALLGDQDVDDLAILVDRAVVK